MNQSEARLEVRRHIFEKTGNSYHVWAALRDARAGGLPAPEWVLENLSHIAEQLLALDIKGSADPYKPLAKVLGMESPGPGRNTPLSDFQRHERDYELATCVVDHLTSIPRNEQGDYTIGLPKACEIAASEKGTNPQAAKKAFKWLRDNLGLRFI